MRLSYSVFPWKLRLAWGICWLGMLLCVGLVLASPLYSQTFMGDTLLLPHLRLKGISLTVNAVGGQSVVQYRFSNGMWKEVILQKIGDEFYKGQLFLLGYWGSCWCVGDRVSVGLVPSDQLPASLQRCAPHTLLSLVGGLPKGDAKTLLAQSVLFWYQDRWWKVVPMGRTKVYDYHFGGDCCAACVFRNEI